MSIKSIVLTSDEERNMFLPTHFGDRYFEMESSVYALASRYIMGYRGGEWNYVNLDNGGGFMHLRCLGDDFVRFIVEHKQIDMSMSHEASGIVICLYVLRVMANKYMQDIIIEKHNALIDYAREHREWSKIQQAI